MTTRGWSSRFLRSIFQLSKMGKIIRCAQCGRVIPVGDDYYIVGDNTIQAKFFTDSPQYNCFCSRDCLCNALTVMAIENDGNCDFGEPDNDEDKVAALKERLVVRKRQDFPAFPGVHDKWDIWDSKRNDWANEGYHGPFFRRKDAESAVEALAQEYGRMKIVLS